MNKPTEADKYRGAEDDDVTIIIAVPMAKSHLCKAVCHPDNPELKLMEDTDEL